MGGGASENVETFNCTFSASSGGSICFGPKEAIRIALFFVGWSDKRGRYLGTHLAWAIAATPGVRFTDYIFKTSVSNIISHNVPKRATSPRFVRRVWRTSATVRCEAGLGRANIINGRLVKNKLARHKHVVTRQEFVWRPAPTKMMSQQTFWASGPKTTCNKMSRVVVLRGGEERLHQRMGSNFSKSSANSLNEPNSQVDVIHP